MRSFSTLTLAVVAAAIIITTAMDAVGWSMFSAFSLMALIPVYWFFSRHSWKSWGFRWGRPGDYGIALLYPVFVMGVLALLLLLSGEDLSNTDWQAAARGFGIIALASITGSYITEEGFFRGTLFAAAQRESLTPQQTILLTSLIFSAWHISWATLAEEGRVELAVLPVYLINAALLGAAWGLMRQLSGSVLVAATSHGVWNGAAYSLFGFGSDSGVLQIASPLWLDPERGLVAIALNGLFVAWLWRKSPAQSE